MCSFVRPHTHIKDAVDFYFCLFHFHVLMFSVWMWVSTISIISVRHSQTHTSLESQCEFIPPPTVTHHSHHS